jgi:hypothetical protein
MYNGLLVCLSLVLFCSCSAKLHVRHATADDILRIARPVDGPKVSGCYEPLSYVKHPELMRTKYVRVNLHFMATSDGRYGLPEDKVKQYAIDLIHAANHNLQRNTQMFLPHGNTTPVMPIPFRYVITPDPAVPGDDGIYYHVDDTLFLAVKTGRDRNITDKRVIHKYTVQKDSVLNIFFQSHHKDSIPSRTYKADRSGISLGSAVKLFGNWSDNPSYWDYRGLLNHEIGHSLGLSHTWSGFDGCDDTPANPNCWNVTATPPCDSFLSNNVMDYNLHMAAYTPCQIGKIMMGMAKVGSIQRSMLQPTWCQIDTSANITIRDSVRWNASVDLEGNVIVERGATLEIGCRVSLPEHATIRLKPGAKLVVLQHGWLHNSCGAQWDGIILESLKKETASVIVVEGGRIEHTPTPITN